MIQRVIMGRQGAHGYLSLPRDPRSSVLYDTSLLRPYERIIWLVDCHGVSHEAAHLFPRFLSLDGVVRGDEGGLATCLGR